MAVYQSIRGWGIDVRDEYGRRRRQHVGTEDAARALEAHMLEEITIRRRSLAVWQSTNDLTLTDAIDLYMSSYAAAPRTKRLALARLAHAGRLLGNQRVADITPKLIQSWYDERQATIGQNTLVSECCTIKSFFTYLHNQGTIPTNPAAHLRPRKVPTPPARIITYEEEAKLSQAATEKARTRLILALDAGLRASEITHLRVNHYAAQNHALTVWSTKTHSTRTIPTTDRLHYALTLTHATVTNPDAYIVQRSAQPITDTGPIIRRLNRITGVICKFHELRHTFASRIATASAELRLPPAVLRELLGHAPKSTTEIYEHATWEQKQRAVAHMEHSRLDHERQTRGEKGGPTPCQENVTDSSSPQDPSQE